MLWIYLREIFQQNSLKKKLQNQMKNKHVQIRVITKLPNIEQSFNGKGKTHKSTTGKLGKPQWP
jgi:hypothetical protein